MVSGKLFQHRSCPADPHRRALTLLVEPFEPVKARPLYDLNNVFGGTLNLTQPSGIVVSSLASINKVSLRRLFSTEMGNCVRVQFPVSDIYFGV